MEKYKPHISYKTYQEAKEAWTACDYIVINVYTKKFQGALRGWYGTHLRKDGSTFPQHWSEIPNL